MANHGDFPDHGVCPAATDVTSGGLLILAFPWCLLYPTPIPFFVFERVIEEEAVARFFRPNTPAAGPAAILQF